MKRMNFILYMLYGIVFFVACTYDYNMPDMSNATPHGPSVSEPSYYYGVTYGSDITSLIMEEAERLGYEVAAIKKIGIEKDRNGNILVERQMPNGSDCIESMQGANAIEFVLKCEGWPKGSYDNRVLVCTLSFEPFNLKDNNNKTITLTTDMPYTLELLPDSERIYNYSVTYGSDMSSLISNTLETIGYEIADTKILITERDKDGNIISERYKPNGDNLLYSTKGAITVRFAVEIYGWPKGSYDNKEKCCTIVFNEDFNLEEINGKKIVLSKDMSYLISTEKDIFSIKQKKYEVPSIGGNIQVEVISSGEYSVQLPNVNWITETTPKAIDTNVHVFTIATNNSSEKRKTAIIFIDNKSGVTEQVTIVQLGNSNDNTTDGNIDGMPIEPW